MMDKAEFTAAVLEAEPALYRVAKAMLRSEQDCADAPYKQEQAECIPAPAADDHSDLYEALLSLDEKYRLPVVLFYLEGFKTREIAGLLGVPEGTVKSRLRTARELLRKDLEGACFA